MTRAAALAARLVCVAAACACSRATPIDSCEDSLHGVWRTEGDQPWMIVDRRTALEIYPLFDDSRPEAGPDVVVAPRAIDLVRTGRELRGTLVRRYMRRADRCDALMPVRITGCAADRLELVLADPVPPVTFAPCTWGRGAASRVERWRRD